MFSIAAHVAHTKVGDNALRLGLASRSVIYLVLAYLIARIALGALGDPDTSERANAPGVAQAVAAQAGGRVVVFVLSVGLLLFSSFSVLDALHHHEHEEPDAKRWANKALSAWTVLVYAAFGVYCLVTAFRNTSGTAKHSDQHSVQWSARVLRWPGGPVWLALLGAVLGTSAVVLVVMAVRRSFMGQLDKRRLAGRMRQLTVTLGIIGYVGRAGLFALVCSFVLKAAFTEDPNDDEGVDGSLRILAATGFGPILLWALAATVGCYAVYMALEARYRRV